MGDQDASITLTEPGDEEPLPIDKPEKESREDTEAVPPVERGALVDRLARELEATNDSESLDTIRGRLGTDTESIEVSVDHCLSRLSKFDAYVDALEEFIDEEGTAQRLIDEFREDVADVEVELEQVHSELADVQETQSAYEDRLTAAESELEALAEIDRKVDQIETRCDDAIVGLQADVEGLQSDVEELDEWRATVVDAVRGDSDGSGDDLEERDDTQAQSAGADD
jgi:DNA repair exonuclease SbcCD ATPase subunit